ncbi:MAG: glycosyltransferase family 4 protein [Candidatus Omnitrophica bacterium]|nr:glycosyltransferase family 4 protein [Candidatus Omnitrophota bacterium]
MNIGIFSSTYLPVIGGVQYELYWLLKAIDNRYQKKNIDHFVFIAPASDNKEYLQFRNITVVYLDVSNRYDIPLCGYKLAAIAKKYKLGLVNCWQAIPDGIVCLLMKWITGVPYILTSQGVDTAYNRRYDYGYRLKKKLSGIIRLVLKQSCSVITVSRDMKDYVEEAGAKKNKIKIIPNGIELAEETYSEQNILKHKQQIKEMYAVNSSHTVYLTLSGMRKIKGHENLVRAFALALKINPNLKLFISAHGEETENIKMLVKDLKLEYAINFIGFVTGVEKKAWFDIADVYCNTAFFEPFGIVYLEAIKYNLALLGTVFGGAKDIFEHNKSAYLVNPENIDEISKGLITLSSAEYRKNLVKESKLLLPRYDINRIANLYLDIFVEYAYE